MGLTDLAPDLLREVLGPRPVRSYQAILSTESDAQAWARAGAADGSLVVADYQVSPRGRGGLPWTVQPGTDLGFSLVVRPDLPVEREGWLYPGAVMGLSDAFDGDLRVAWPDQVRRDAEVVAAVGVHVELGPARVEWAVVTVLAAGVEVARTELLARVVAAIEQRLGEPVERVLADLKPQCETLGRQVRARLVPLGPAGPVVTGRAADLLADGSLVVQRDDGARVAVPPQTLGVLDWIDEQSAHDG